jgi:hypothetical protein
MSAVKNLKEILSRVVIMSKTTLATTLIAVLSLGLSACSPVRTVRNIIDAPLAWEFLQTEGSLTIGKPRVEGTVMWLPLEVILPPPMTGANGELAEKPLKCLRAELHQTKQLSKPLGYYDLDLTVHAGDADKNAQGSCEEVPLFIGDLDPPFVASRKMAMRVWYVDKPFSRHLVKEVTP